MNMKRLYVLTMLVLSCTLAFSQHPYSHSGGAFYWAIIGGISAVLLYLLRFLLIFFIATIKGAYKKWNEKKSEFKGTCESDGNTIGCYEPEEDSPIEENNKVISDELFNEELKSTENKVHCVHCDKLISADSSYCNYCGFKQTAVISNLNKFTRYIDKFMKKFVRFLLYSAICGAIGLIPAFISCKIANDDDYLGPCVLTPTFAYWVYCLVNYVFANRKIIRNVFITLLGIIISCVWMLCLYNGYQQKKYKEEQLIEEENLRKQEEEMHRVNRTFLGCSLGDNASKVSKTLRKYVPNHLLPAMRFIGDRIDKIWLEDIQYGDYTLNSISFLFDQDRLYKVIMNVQTHENESYYDLWTYNHLSNMLDNKYKKDYSAEEYNNVKNYCDDHTEVRLWHATYGMGKYEVTLTYYDKDSGHEEHQEEGF